MTTKSKVITLIVLAAVAITVFLGARHIPPTLELLDTAGLPRSYAFRVKGRLYWEDWLNYVAGYEIIAAEIPCEDWQTPDSWQTGTVTLTDIQKKCGIAVDEAAISRLRIDPLPDEYDQWFFCEDRDASECWIGMHSRSGTLIIYHGLELWVGGGYSYHYE